MSRNRRFGVALAALLVALLLISGTGSFSAMTGERTTDVSVVDDADAYLGVEQEIVENSESADDSLATEPEDDTSTTEPEDTTTTETADDTTTTETEEDTTTTETEDDTSTTETEDDTSTTETEDDTSTTETEDSDTADDDSTASDDNTTSSMDDATESTQTLELTITNRFTHGVTIEASVGKESESTSLAPGKSHTFEFDPVECGEPITIAATGSGVEATLDRTVECD